MWYVIQETQLYVLSYLTQIWVYITVFFEVILVFHFVLAGVDGSLKNATISSNLPINIMNWNKYQRLKVIYDYMLSMELSHPDIVQVHKFKIIKLK